MIYTLHIYDTKSILQSVVWLQLISLITHVVTFVTVCCAVKYHSVT